jgi:hypothetical protein
MAQETLPSEVLDPARLGRFETAFQELLDLQIGLEEIPEGDTCYLCNTQTRKDVTEYEVFPSTGTNIHLVERVEKILPGYECPNEECGVVYLEDTTQDRFLNAVANGMANLGDTSLREYLEIRSQKINYSPEA